MTRIDLIERAETLAPKVAARELARQYPREFRVTPGWGDAAGVTPLGVLGEVQAGGVHWVVRSKLPAGCLARLVDPALTPGRSGDDVPGLPELLAAKLCEYLRAHPPTRGYAEEAGRSASVRGRIDFAELARDANPFAPLPVVADEFTLNQPRNQAPVAAIDRLLTAPLPATIRGELQSARLWYPGVNPHTPTDQEWAKLLVEPSPGRELLEWSRLVLTGSNVAGTGFLVRLETLFERFARDTLRALVPATWGVTDPELTLHAERGPTLSFRPDCVVHKPGGPVSVWDAKWKALKRTGPNPADVQQALAYARLLGVRSCGLVYPGIRPAMVRYRLPAGVLFIVRLGLAEVRVPVGFRKAATNA